MPHFKPMDLATTIRQFLNLNSHYNDNFPTFKLFVINENNICKFTYYGSFVRNIYMSAIQSLNE